MANDDPELTEYFLGQIAIRKKAYDAGVLAALYDAISICMLEQIPAPSWVLAAMLDILEKAVAGKLSNRRGRTGNPLAKYRADLVHYTRWDAVTEVREKQGEYKQCLQKIAAMELSDEKRRTLISSMRDPGRSWNDAYALAVEFLKGTRAFGSPATMRNSYKLVQKSISDPSQHGRFYIVDYRTIRRLGIDDDYSLFT